jgi:hypothetical protein
MLRAAFIMAASTLGSRFGTSSSQLATRTRGRPRSTTDVGRTSIDTPPTWWWRSSRVAERSVPGRTRENDS